MPYEIARPSASSDERGADVQSVAISQPRQVLANHAFQQRTLGKLLTEVRRQPRHLLLERLAVGLLLRRTDVAAGCQHVVVLADVVEPHGHAEAGLVGVARALPPDVEGAGDLADVFNAEIAQHAVLHVAEVASVDEERLAGALAT